MWICLPTQGTGYTPASSRGMDKRTGQKKNKGAKQNVTRTWKSWSCQYHLSNMSAYPSPAFHGFQIRWAAPVGGCSSLRTAPKRFGGNYGTASYEIRQGLLPCHHHLRYTSISAFQSTPTQFCENGLSLKKEVLPFWVFKLPVLFSQMPNLLNWFICTVHLTSFLIFSELFLDHRRI